MDQPKQPKSNFVTNLNFRRNGNKEAPSITGRISTPEDPETEFSFSAFRQDSDKGPNHYFRPASRRHQQP